MAANAQGLVDQTQKKLQADVLEQKVGRKKLCSAIEIKSFSECKAHFTWESYVLTYQLLICI